MPSPGPEEWAGRLVDALRDHERERAALGSSLPRYDISSEPKRGGMGVVYRAWDRQLGRQVALKVLRQQVGSTPEAQARFLQEAQLASRLNHPNIVPVYDTGTWMDTDKPYIVMQYVDGGTLEETKPSGIREAARLIAQAARAVHFAHEHGVVHRDLKPQNIMVDKKGHVFVTDFGLAKASATGESSFSVSGEILGTPAYMAPEQALGKLEEVDHQSDVYSLGATLYALVTGHAPARGKTSEEIRVDVVTGKVRRPGEIRPECPKRLERVILKALAKRKEERHRSAAELAREIEGFLSEAEPGPIRRLLRRRGLKWTTAASLTLALVLWLVLGSPSRLGPLEQEISNRLDDRDYSEALVLVRELNALDLPEPLLTPRREKIAERVVDDLEDWEKQPGALALGTVAVALDVLRALDPTNPGIEEFDKLRGLRTLRKETVQPGPSSVELLRVLLAMEEIDPSHALTAEARGVYEHKLKAERESLTLQERSKSRWEQAPLVFNPDTLSRFNEILEESKGLAERLGTEDSKKRAEDLEDARAWLKAYQAAKDMAARDPDGALERHAELADQAVHHDFQSAVARHLTSLKEQIERGWARVLLRTVLAACETWDLATAENALKRVEQSGVEGLDKDIGEARRRIAAVKQVEDRLAECRRHIDGDNLADALRTFESLEKEAPRHPRLEELTFRLLKLRGRKGDEKGFLDAYRSLAGQKLLSDPERRGELTEVLLQVARRSADPAKVWRAALRALEDVVKPGSVQPEALLERAVLHRRLGDYDAALSHAMKADPKDDNVDAILLRGQIHYLKKEYTQALEDFGAAAREDGKNPRVAYWQAQCRDALRDSAGALQAYRESVAKGFSGGDVHYQIARISVESKQYGNAVASATKALKGDELLSEDGLVARHGEQQAYSKVLDRFYRDSRYTLARGLFGQERYHDCVRECTKVLARDDEFAQAFYLRGYAQFKLERDAEAILDLETCIRLSPGPEGVQRAGSAQRLIDKSRERLKR